MKRVKGRRAETNLLWECCNSRKSEFIALCGRHGVGKTFLVRQFFEDRFCFHVTGLVGGSYTDELKEFVKALFKHDYRAVKPKNWHEAFLLLGNLTAAWCGGPNRLVVVFIDRAQCFDTQRSGFLTELAYYWRDWASRLENVCLVVSSSDPSFFTRGFVEREEDGNSRSDEIAGEGIGGVEDIEAPRIDSDCLSGSADSARCGIESIEVQEFERNSSSGPAGSLLRGIEGIEAYGIDDFSSSKSSDSARCGIEGSGMGEPEDGLAGLSRIVTRMIRLRPFTLRQTAAYLKGRKFGWQKSSVLQAYMALGGIPQYLSLLDASKSVEENVRDLCIGPSAELRDEFPKLFESFRPNQQVHMKIIQILGAHPEGLTCTELAKEMRFSYGRHLRKLLWNLEYCNLVRRMTNFSLGNNDIYVLSDPYCLFYCNFLAEESASEPSVVKDRQDWSEAAFRLVCIGHAEQIFKGLQSREAEQISIETQLQEAGQISSETQSLDAGPNSGGLQSRDAGQISSEPQSQGAEQNFGGLQSLDAEPCLLRSADSDGVAEVDLIGIRGNGTAVLFLLKYEDGKYIIDRETCREIRRGISRLKARKHYWKPFQVVWVAPKKPRSVTPPEFFLTVLTLEELFG